jgi:AcrR family transcriptional regulator
MESRDRILQAAARVYAETGFRGATTRRIAGEAGVNEVTLFRIFGSKAALLDELLKAGAAQVPVTHLPETPANPLREVTAWCAAHLAHLRASRSIMLKMMSELDERPDLGPCAGAGPACTARELHGYVERLRRAGFVTSGTDATTAVSMLMGALFGDAVARGVAPEVFPQPESAAARHYARAFLRLLGVEQKQPATAEPEKAAKPAKTSQPASRRRTSGTR